MLVDFCKWWAKIQTIQIELQCLSRIPSYNSFMVFPCSGYMSPEYAFHGQFSVRSDVFSFGVLLLEIVMGQKNSSFYQSDHGQDLLSYVSIWFVSGTSKYI